MINFTKKLKNIKDKIKVFVRSHTGQQTLMNANKWILAAIVYRYKSVIAHMKRTYNSRGRGKQSFFWVYLQI